MDSAVYIERRDADVKAYMDAAAALVPLRDATTTSPAERHVLGEAESMLREAAVMIARLGDALLPYSDPDFYRDLPPSRATEDQGKYAANALEYVFSE